MTWEESMKRRSPLASSENAATPSSSARRRTTSTSSRASQGISKGSMHLLPLNNGGGYLRECVTSVLAQTAGDLELVALDDASTDGGVEWLQSLGDRRARVSRAPRHLGIEANWSRILEVEKNEFLTIIGQDDVL